MTIYLAGGGRLGEVCGLGKLGGLDMSFLSTGCWAAKEWAGCLHWVDILYKHSPISARMPPWPPCPSGRAVYHPSHSGLPPRAAGRTLYLDSSNPTPADTDWQYHQAIITLWELLRNLCHVIDTFLTLDFTENQLTHFI